MNDHTPQPSSAQMPDLDWSQVRETVLMLNLAVAQINGAMRDGDDSVSALADSFTSMMGNAEMIHAAADNLPDNPERTAIISNCEAVANQMQSTIVAFQFYDKLNQRLSHLTNSLAALAKLIDTPEELYSPYAWRGLQEKIKSKYTVDADKAMFDAILAGASVEEALQQCAQQPGEAEDDIELF